MKKVGKAKPAAKNLKPREVAQRLGVTPADAQAALDAQNDAATRPGGLTKQERLSTAARRVGITTDEPPAPPPSADADLLNSCGPSSVCRKDARNTGVTEQMSFSRTLEAVFSGGVTCDELADEGRRQGGPVDPGQPTEADWGVYFAEFGDVYTRYPELRDELRPSSVVAWTRWFYNNRGPKWMIDKFVLDVR